MTEEQIAARLGRLMQGAPIVEQRSSRVPWGTILVLAGVAGVIVVAVKMGWITSLKDWLSSLWDKTPHRELEREIEKLRKYMSRENAVLREGSHGGTASMHAREVVTRNFTAVFGSKGTKGRYWVVAGSRLLYADPKGTIRWDYHPGSTDEDDLIGETQVAWVNKLMKSYVRCIEDADWVSLQPILTVLGPAVGTDPDGWSSKRQPALASDPAATVLSPNATKSGWVARRLRDVRPDAPLGVVVGVATSGTALEPGFYKGWDFWPGASKVSLGQANLPATLSSFTPMADSTIADDIPRLEEALK